MSAFKLPCGCTPDRKTDFLPPSAMCEVHRDIHLAVSARWRTEHDARRVIANAEFLHNLEKTP